MGGYDHILSKYYLFLTFPVGKICKIRLCKTVFLHKNLENAEFTNKKHGKPTLHSLIAKHVLEISVKLKFHCVRFNKKHCFALMVLNRFPISFYQGLFTRCDLYRRILLYYYPETKEMICESVNLKGVVYEPNKTLPKTQPSVYHHTYRFCKRWPDLF